MIVPFQLRFYVYDSASLFDASSIVVLPVRQEGADRRHEETRGRDDNERDPAAHLAEEEGRLGAHDAPESSEDVEWEDHDVEREREGRGRGRLVGRGGQVPRDSGREGAPARVSDGRAVLCLPGAVVQLVRGRHGAENGQTARERNDEHKSDE